MHRLRLEIFDHSLEQRCRDAIGVDGSWFFRTGLLGLGDGIAGGGQIIGRRCIDIGDFLSRDRIGRRRQDLFGMPARAGVFVDTEFFRKIDVVVIGHCLGEFLVQVRDRLFLFLYELIRCF